MIEAIEIQGIQCYTERTKIMLHPGVNVFLGESDAGKSALAIRALYWVSHNAGLGAGSLDPKLAMVRLHVKNEDGARAIVERVRTKAENYYRVKHNGEWSEKYKNLKSGIPQEVQNALGLTDLNYHHQFESQFLMTCNGGERARALNDIVALQVIDSSASAANSDVLGIDADLKKAGAELDALETSLKSYAYLDEAEGRLVALEQFEAQINAKKRKSDSIFSLVVSIKGLEKEIEQYNALPEIEEKLKDLEEDFRQYQKQQAKRNQLSMLLTGIKKSEEQLEAVVDSFAVDDQLNVLENRCEALWAKQADSAALAAIIDSAKVNEKRLSDIEARIVKDESRFKALMPDVCPLCEK
jgi:hypothetical protein